MEACVHPFFDELRNPNIRLPNGNLPPPLFDFTPEGGSLFSFILFILFHLTHVLILTVPGSDRSAELENASPELIQRLMPENGKKVNA